MALFTSSVFAEIRGSIGGTTYSRNKAGAYTRNRTKPINPSTAKQAAVRAQFSVSAAGYSMLTAVQVATWQEFALTYPQKNSVGLEYIPTPKQCYVQLNQNLQSIGETPITDAPFGVPATPSVDLEGVTVTAEVDGGVISTLEVSGITSDLATAVIVLQFSPPMNASRQSYRNRMRQIRFGVQGVLQAAGTLYNSYFSNPSATVGQIVRCRVAAVDPATGISSGWFYLENTVLVAA